MGLILALIHISLEAFLFGIYGGIVFGLIMSLLLVTLHFLFTGKYRKLKDINIGSVVQTKNIDLLLDYRQSYELCSEAFKVIKKSVVVSENKNLGVIRVEVPSSIKSFGEVLEFKIVKITNRNTRVQITSRPKRKNTIIDYGKNIENILIIASFFGSSGEESLYRDRE